MDETIIMHEESPGESWANIAASAYRAYFESRGMKYPAFEKLRPEIQTAIEAAVRQADDVGRIGSKAFNWENRWNGWIPPHMRLSGNRH